MLVSIDAVVDRLLIISLNIFGNYLTGEEILVFKLTPTCLSIKLRPSQVELDLMASSLKEILKNPISPSAHAVAMADPSGEKLAVNMVDLGSSM